MEVAEGEELESNTLLVGQRNPAKCIVLEALRLVLGLAGFRAPGTGFCRFWSHRLGLKWAIPRIKVSF